MALLLYGKVAFINITVPFANDFNPTICECYPVHYINQMLRQRMPIVIRCITQWELLILAIAYVTISSKLPGCYHKMIHTNVNKNYSTLE